LVKSTAALEKEVNSQIEQVQNGQGQITDFIRVAKEAAALLREIRLDGTKTIKSEKDRKKQEVIAKAQREVADFNEEWNKILSPHSSTVDFVKTSPEVAAAMRGKKNLQSIQDSVDSAVANWKVEADTILRRVTGNIKIIQDNDGGFEFLFNDWRSWVGGEPEAVLATTQKRVADHQASEAKRLEVERERIREEEKAKAEADKQFAIEAARQDEAQKQRIIAEQQRQARQKEIEDGKKKQERVAREIQEKNKLEEQETVKSEAVPGKVAQEEPQITIQDYSHPNFTQPSREEIINQPNPMEQSKKTLPKDGSRTVVLHPVEVHWKKYAEKSIQFRSGQDGRWVDSNEMPVPFNPEDCSLA
jgi:hypothetical protein